MKTNLLSFLLGFTALLFSACGNDKPAPPQAPATDTAAAPAATPMATKPELELYAILVDKLNLREQPNKSGKALTQLAEGDVVEGTGTVSAEREEATLRGISYLEPYFEVSSTTPTQQKGWAYGGALQRLYAGSRSDSPDLEKIRQFTAHLKSLNTKKLDSGKKAWDYVRTNFANASGPLADAAFTLLEKFLFRMEVEGEYYQITEKMKWSQADYEAINQHKYDMTRNAQTRSLADNGFMLAVGEGMVFPVVDWKPLSAFFSEKSTPALREYLKLQVAEQDEVAFEDGGLIIPLDRLAQRAYNWENFNETYLYFIRREETQESERWTRLVLVNGSDNTPTFSYEDQQITADYRKVWALILEKYPNSKLAATVKEISTLAAAEGWKRSAKVEQWQTNFANQYSEALK